MMPATTENAGSDTDSSGAAGPTPEPTLPDIGSLSLGGHSSTFASGSGAGAPPPPPPPPAPPATAPNVPGAPSIPFSLGGTPYRQPGEKTSAVNTDDTGGKSPAKGPKGPDGFTDALQAHINSFKSVQDRHKEEKQKEFEQDQFTNLPSQLMMTAAKADKKPFTYTPVGLKSEHLKAPSTIRREKLAKSAMGNYSGAGSGYESNGDETPIQRATSLSKLARSASQFGSGDESGPSGTGPVNNKYNMTNNYAGGVNPALQSRSFKMLQNVTGSGAEDDYGAQTDTEGPRYSSGRPTQLERRGSQPFNDHASTWRPSSQQQQQQQQQQYQQPQQVQYVQQPVAQQARPPRMVSQQQLVMSSPRSPTQHVVQPQHAQQVHYVQPQQQQQPQMYRTSSAAAPGDPSRVITSYTPVSPTDNVHGNSEDWSPYSNLTDETGQNIRYQGAEIPSKIFRYLQTQMPVNAAAPQQHQQQQQPQHAASQRLGGQDFHMTQPVYHAPSHSNNSNTALAQRVTFSNEPARHFGGGVMENLQKYFGAEGPPAGMTGYGDAAPREVSRVTSFGPNGEQRVTTTYAYGTPGSGPSGTYTTVEETSAYNAGGGGNNNGRGSSSNGRAYSGTSTMSSPPHSTSSRGGSEYGGDYGGHNSGNNWHSSPVGNSGMISTVTKIMPTSTWHQPPQQQQQPQWATQQQSKPVRPSYYNGQSDF